jgi:hypothetical protein
VCTCTWPASAHQLGQVVGADQVADDVPLDEIMSMVAILTVPPYPMM